MTTRVALDDAEGLARTAVAHGLRRSRVELPTAVVPDAAWTWLWSLVRARRLPGFLAAAVADGWPVDRFQAEQVADGHRRAAASCLLLERLLLDLAGELEAATVTYRVLKGPAHAHLLYADPAVRAFVDVDLLVRAEDLAAAGAVLTARGGERRFPEPRPGYDRRFGKGAAYRLPGGWEVDLHRTLAPGPFGLAFDPAVLLSGASSLVLGGRTLPVLDAADRFVHACAHAVLGSPEPNDVALRDAAQAVEVGLDVPVALARAEDLGLGAVVARAVDDLVDRLWWEPPPSLRAWRADRVASRRERRWLASYRGAGASVRKTLVAVEAVRGPRAKAAYAAAVVLPSEAGRGRSTTQRWQQGARTLRR